MAPLTPGPDFPALLTAFVTSYLPRTRGCSLNTIRSYRDTFVLLLRYLATEHSTNPDCCAALKVPMGAVSGMARLVA
jgi:site-specific recombinase XerD